MGILVVGVVMMAAILGIFWWKDVTEKLWVARLAYSRFTARLAVLAAALIGVGVLMVLGSVWDRLAPG